MSYVEVASVEGRFRRAAGMLTEAWANASAAARIVRAQGHRRVVGDSGRELRRGTLGEPPVMLVHGCGANNHAILQLRGGFYLLWSVRSRSPSAEPGVR